MAAAYKAIGFDLFNTLIVAQPSAVQEAVQRLLGSLRASGFELNADAFRQAHREAALARIEASHKDGRETHNRFWISDALQRLGYAVEPDDPRVAKAVEDYFALFPRRCSLIPGTAELLGNLKACYRLGLLSNFTHAPAAAAIIEAVGLNPFFDVVLISGQLGYRKPHPRVFEDLVRELGVRREELLFVGDDPDADIKGALAAGISAVWTTCVQDQDLPAAKTLLPKAGPVPRDGVARISSWEDLRVLLGKSCGGKPPQQVK